MRPLKKPCAGVRQPRKYEVQLISGEKLELTLDGVVSLCHGVPRETVKARLARGYRTIKGLCEQHGRIEVLRRDDD